MSSALRVDIVIPAYNAASLLPRVLPAAFAAIRGEGKVIVVDAGAEDDTARVAEELGANVVRIAQRAGPAQARNRGVEESDADVVLFIDADCVPHDDVVERVAAAFGDDPELVSLTGSYDADPPESNFGSMYMNLRHHFTHQRANREGATFWSGCGAVRRTRFVEIGGFDADRYPRPSIEDIEMGQRLASIGRMCLDPDLQVTHLKRWTVKSVIETDIKDRAIPWSLLLHTGGGAPDDLNLRHRERVAAGIAPFALLGIVGIAAFPLLWAGDFPLPGWPVMAMAILPVVIAFILSRDIVRFWWKTRGFWFALRAGIFQQIHLLYSAITFVLCGVWVRLGGGREESRV